MGSDIDGACTTKTKLLEKRKENKMKTFSITDVGMVDMVNQDYVSYDRQNH